MDDDAMTMKEVLARVREIVSMVGSSEVPVVHLPMFIEGKMVLACATLEHINLNLDRNNRIVLSCSPIDLGKLGVSMKPKETPE